MTQNHKKILLHAHQQGYNNGGQGGEEKEEGEEEGEEDQWSGSGNVGQRG